MSATQALESAAGFLQDDFFDQLENAMDDCHTYAEESDDEDEDEDDVSDSDDDESKEQYSDKEEEQEEEDGDEDRHNMQEAWPSAVFPLVEEDQGQVEPTSTKTKCNNLSKSASTHERVVPKRAGSSPSLLETLPQDGVKKSSSYVENLGELEDQTAAVIPLNEKGSVWKVVKAAPAVRRVGSSPCLLESTGKSIGTLRKTPSDTSSMHDEIDSLKKSADLDTASVTTASTQGGTRRTSRRGSSPGVLETALFPTATPAMRDHDPFTLTTPSADQDQATKALSDLLQYNEQMLRAGSSPCLLLGNNNSSSLTTLPFEAMVKNSGGGLATMALSQTELQSTLQQRGSSPGLLQNNAFPTFDAFPSDDSGLNNNTGAATQVLNELLQYNDQMLQRAAGPATASLGRLPSEGQDLATMALNDLLHNVQVLQGVGSSSSLAFDSNGGESKAKKNKRAAPSKKSTLKKSSSLLAQKMENLVLEDDGMQMDVMKLEKASFKDVMRRSVGGSSPSLLQTATQSSECDDWRN